MGVLMSPHDMWFPFKNFPPVIYYHINQPMKYASMNVRLQLNVELDEPHFLLKANTGACFTAVV